ncbi:MULTISPECIES: PBSX family phage terminase large subunit [Bacillus subtilis group]|uniref:PBSX family phage terminase large subunit n=1 Tax=Bacillus subtilis group TaxID=653685 RepID=UPI000EF24EF8|nr:MULTISPECIES: PBSX family phage terminase large subunit [Bacillus subtilis group]AYK60065.1 PBSX family phage terminase large subunit [Bacillus subtilis subsp. subtilis]MCM3190249.1 PBSX family phage terminase large subunit [Bacillus subtilis]MCU9592221.1 PBSX family phage terminase large subunit [Bacillus velezensis]MDI6546713.1 PBSX family phage terminase large subunit [Bacillus subtilis]MEC1257668.1 PBSX family phage terminase large subunit [Bacillus subtilis]
MINTVRVSLKEIVGGGYKTFWNYEGRYRVVKGGRGSKKSTTTALNIIYRMMQFPQANTLVVRKVFKDHKDSTYAQLKWAIRRLKVEHLWEWTKSPLEIRYKPTGQKILFRGLDDPMSVTSITVDVGFLCWAWFEEAYQILNEDDFNKVDMSIRGELPPGYFKQITLSFNPWNEKHWLKRRFFDVQDNNILALTTNYKCNEFLGDDDRQLFDWMKKNNLRRYKIEGLGEWGIAEGAIFTNWREFAFDRFEIAKREGVKSAFGLDFGFTTDPSALACSLVDIKNRELYIFDEMYKPGLLNNEIAETITDMGYRKELIIADSAEQKSIAELRKYGLKKIKPAEKGPDSIKAGIQFLQQFTIFIHPKCSNAAMEFSNYVWDKNKDGKLINKPVDEYNHFIDALRYSMEPIKKRVRL